jgi:hypothetical protein
VVVEVEQEMDVVHLILVEEVEQVVLELVLLFQLQEIQHIQLQ